MNDIFQLKKTPNQYISNHQYQFDNHKKYRHFYDNFLHTAPLQKPYLGYSNSTAKIPRPQNRSPMALFSGDFALLTILIALLSSGIAESVGIGIGVGDEIGALESKSRQREFDYFALALQWAPTYCRRTRHCCSSNACCRGLSRFFLLLLLFFFFFLVPNMILWFDILIMLIVVLIL